VSAFGETLARLVVGLGGTGDLLGLQAHLELADAEHALLVAGTYGSIT